MTNCVFLDNVAAVRGGGVYAGGSTYIADCSFIGNAAEAGGGLCAYYLSGAVVNCSFDGNTAHSGGGVYIYYLGQVRDCVLCNSQATDGGGAYLYYGGLLDRCSIVDNVANAYAGGVRCERGALRNCLVARNQVQQYLGGGIQVSGAAVIENCTVARNRATSASYGSGMTFTSGGTLRNTILWGNTGAPQLYVSGTLTSEYNCIQDWTGGGLQISTNDPLLTMLDAGDYHLLPASPCRNTGTNQAWMVAASDRDGQARILEGRVDRGAYELGRFIAGFTANVHKGIEPLPVQFNGYATGTNAAGVALWWDLDGNGYTRNGGTPINFLRAGGGALCDRGGTRNPCVIAGNQASERAGGVMCNSGGTLENCVVQGNHALRGGAAFLDSAGTARNCLMTRNVAGTTGGGLYLAGGGLFDSCTIATTVPAPLAAAFTSRRRRRAT